MKRTLVAVITASAMAEGSLLLIAMQLLESRPAISALVLVFGTTLAMLGYLLGRNFAAERRQRWRVSAELRRHLSSAEDRHTLYSRPNSVQVNDYIMHAMLYDRIARIERELGIKPPMDTLTNPEEG